MLNVLPNANTSLSVNLDRSAPLQYMKSSLIVSHRHCQRSSSSKTSSHTQQDTSRFGRKSICLRAQTVVSGTHWRIFISRVMVVVHLSLSIKKRLKQLPHRSIKQPRIHTHKHVHLLTAPEEAVLHILLYIGASIASVKKAGGR